MDAETIHKNGQLTAERYVLLIYCIYSVVMTAIVIESGWPAGLFAVFVGSFLTSLAVHLGQFRSYRFRAYLTTIMMQICIVLWSVAGASLSMTVSSLSVMVVMVGLYSIPEILYIVISATTILNLYYIFVIRVLKFSEIGVSRMLLEIISIYFVEIVMYLLVKNRLENSELQTAVIASLSEAERCKDDFLMNVSHEIRTPINTICGMSEMILRENLPEQVKEDLYSIRTAGHSLLSIVSDVLDFSELQADHMPLFEEAYTIITTINDVIQMSLSRKNEKPVELVVDCNAALPAVLSGDEQKIRRVMMHLVYNALKFTTEGCVVIVVDARKTSYGVNLIVRVKDTGIGMKEDSLEKLFTSYNQADTRHNRLEGGIGLGLAISQAMVEKMGGFLTVQSVFGKGTEVQFVIPQKVSDDTPVAVVREPERLNVAVYINMEQFGHMETRDAYEQLVTHLSGQLKVKCHLCRNLAELKRRAGREVFTHLFIGIVEYEEEREFFDFLGESVRVVVVAGRRNRERVKNKNIYFLYKPLFIMPVVMLLNDEKIVQGINDIYDFHSRFIAPGVNVLAVDDNLMNVRVLEGLLRPYQIRLSMAMSGAQALEMIDSMAYDLVFMDLMMPEMDGVETMQRIRSKNGNYFKKIPMVVLTANAISGMRENFLTQGFQDFMVKPVEVSILERVLRRNLPQEKLIFTEEETAVTETASIEKMSAIEKAAVIEKTDAIDGAVILEEKAVSENVDVPQAAGRITDLPGDTFQEQTGIRYCGNLHNYIEVLKQNSISGPAHQENIRQSFATGDWKNYTIYVHALKSSMLTIGVSRLSRMAKELEAAGRKEDTAFIISHQEAMMEEYTRILDILQKSKTVWPDQAKDDMTERAGQDTDTYSKSPAKVRALDEEELDCLVQEFEHGVFAFDEKKMYETAACLAQCSYQGENLEEKMQHVVYKIKNSDYMSAYEIISSLK